MKSQIEPFSYDKRRDGDLREALQNKFNKIMGSSPQRGGWTNKENFFVICLLDRESDYKNAKRALTDLGVLSQCFKKFTCKRLNMSVCSNIMKQVNSKVGGESLRLQFPAWVSKNNVMTIGIDVCHAGMGKSIVGFAATVNKEQTAYHGDFCVQEKGKEIVEQQLEGMLDRALQAYRLNVGQMPDRIIVYRDGVGEGQRDYIIQKELSQFQKCLEKYSNKMSVPQITLVVVNKRIQQRMFEMKNGQMQNPKIGSIIDSGLVENNEGNECYDFFLVPQNATQGCVTPVHFFVHYNQSKDLSKDDLEQITYSFCFMYSNWAGTIKVPAPCQCAHKIADYHFQFDQRYIKDWFKKGVVVNQDQLKSKLNYNKEFQNTSYFL